MIVDGLLLIAHGSKDPEWIKPFKAIESELRQRFHGPMILTYLESTAPRIEEGLDYLLKNGATQISVAPLFLSAGTHVRSDIPDLIDRFSLRAAGVSFWILPPIGDLITVQQLIANEVVSQIGRPPNLQSGSIASGQP
jgi:sirohydrochlorin cobaltochelatase